MRRSGTPRPNYTYRAAKRNYDKRHWVGVEPTKTLEHPPLVPIKSERGETSYRALWPKD